MVTEKTNPIKGKFLEELGFLNPKTKQKSFSQERILYWLKQGAKLTPTVNNLLVGEKIIEGAKIKSWRPKPSTVAKKAAKAAKSSAPEVKSEMKVEPEVKEEPVAEPQKTE